MNTKPQIGVGDLNKIYCQDCIEGLRRIEKSSVDLVFADPPFNIGKKYNKNADSRADYQ